MADSPYITVASLQTRVKASRLRQILEIASDADLSADTRLAAAIATANSRVDSYIRTRYVVPLLSGSIPETLVQVAADIAIFTLMQFSEKVTDRDQERFDSAISFLRDVAKGVTIMELPTAEATASTRCAIVGIGSARLSNHTSDDPPSVLNEEWRKQVRY